MSRLQVCDGVAGGDGCGSITFVVVTGEWSVWGESQLRAPVTMLCVKCGYQLLTATWLGDEEDPPKVEAKDAG